METKNLTKSFGIRVPLDMYLKMIEVSAENKITLTDICLYSLANSGILKSNFNFKLGGAVNTDLINENKKLKEERVEIKKIADKMKFEFDRIKNEIDERVEKEVSGHKTKISNMGIQRDMLREKLAEAEQLLNVSIGENTRLVNELRLERLKNDKEFRKGN